MEVCSEDNWNDGNNGPKALASPLAKNVSSLAFISLNSISR